MRSGCLTSSARDNGHGGRWWTLRGRRRRRATPAEPTESLAEQEETRSPLTDSNRRPPPYHQAGATGGNGFRLFQPLSRRSGLPVGYVNPSGGSKRLGAESRRLESASSDPGEGRLLLGGSEAAAGSLLGPCDRQHEMRESEPPSPRTGNRTLPLGEEGAGHNRFCHKTSAAEPSRLSCVAVCLRTVDTTIGRSRRVTPSKGATECAHAQSF